MIKNWSKFNENLSEGFDEKIQGKFLEIRDVFQDFEDDRSLNHYQICFVGEEFKRGGLLFTPLFSNYDTWFPKAISQLKSKSDSFFCAIINLKFPSTEVTDLYAPNSLLDSEGIKKFESLLEINSTLTSLGYTVRYNLSGSHPNYKPVDVYVYFKI